MRHLKDILTSGVAVGGLEISATSLKYLLVKNETIIQASLRLPPGIIEKGAIKNRKNFIEALKNLHGQISPANKIVASILTLPSNLVFTQSFSVPIIEKEHLEESIKLNLQMISPNKIEDSYYDWQEIKINKDLGQLELLGAFAARIVIDEFTTALTEAGFNCVAVEFPGLALARLIRERWGGIEAEQQYLLIYVNSEGLLLVILKNGNVYFNHFTLWQNAAIAGSTFTFDQIKNFLSQELQRVVNFYVGRAGKQISEAILISPVFNYEIVKMISEQMNIKIRNLTIAELPKLQPNWFPVLGSGLRGTVSRSRDTDITLTPTNTQVEYYQERTVTFIGLWRNIIVGTFIFIFAAAITIDTLLIKEQTRLSTKLTTEFSDQDLQNSQSVQSKITDFNHQLDFIEKTSNLETRWSPIISEIAFVSNDITIDRLFLDKINQKGVITGQAKTESSAVEYKNRLSTVAGISDPSLPLSNLQSTIDNLVNFTINFKLIADSKKK